MVHVLFAVEAGVSIHTSVRNVKCKPIELKYKYDLCAVDPFFCSLTSFKPGDALL